MLKHNLMKYSLQHSTIASNVMGLWFGPTLQSFVQCTKRPKGDQRESGAQHAVIRWTKEWLNWHTAEPQLNNSHGPENELATSESHLVSEICIRTCKQMKSLLVVRVTFVRAWLVYRTLHLFVRLKGKKLEDSRPHTTSWGPGKALQYWQNMSLFSMAYNDVWYCCSSPPVRSPRNRKCCSGPKYRPLCTNGFYRALSASTFLIIISSFIKVGGPFLLLHFQSCVKEDVGSDKLWLLPQWWHNGGRMVHNVHTSKTSKCLVVGGEWKWY